jgi:hypothetical protein
MTNNIICLQFQSCVCQFRRSSRSIVAIRLTALCEVAPRGVACRCLSGGAVCPRHPPVPYRLSPSGPVSCLITPSLASRLAMSAAAPPATSQKEAAAQQQQQQPTMDTTPPPQTEPQGEKTSAHAETAAAGKEGTTNNAAAAQPPASGDELNIEQFAFRLPNY